MSITDLPGTGIDKSIEVPYIRGAFDLGRTSVPYFTACLQASDLRAMLRLPSQLPPDPDLPIKIEELFQRELDEKRVREKIMPYLRDDERLRFFNALTVALLPLDPDEPRRLARAYPEAEGLAPSAREGLEGTAVGPVMLSHPTDTDAVGYLSWNTALTMPVVLDGQHRFKAIELLLSETAGRLYNDLAAMKVSILFLVLDERAGFRGNEGMSVLAACRDIFIDLNKHAVTVPRARMALLDDRSPWSMSLRAIIAPGVRVDERPVEQRVSEEGKLPLTLIDWRGASAKFATGPYVTSLLTLQDIVEHVLGVPPFRPSDYDRARVVVERLNARLDLRDSPEFNATALSDGIAKAEKEESLFDLPRPATEAVAAKFAATLGQRIVEPLVHLRPYAALIEALRSCGVLETGLELWLSFNADERRALLNELGEDDPESAVEAATTKVKQETYDLAFQVVFQKAFVYSLNSMLNEAEAVADCWGLLIGDGGDPQDIVLAEWIERFNRSLDPALRADRGDSPFLGSGLRPAGEIDFRKTRIRTITGFVSYTMLAPIDEWAVQARAAELDAADIATWVREKWALIAPGPRAPLDGLFSLHGKNWRYGVEEFVRARVDGYEDLDEDEQAEARIAHAAGQLQRVVAVASPAGA